MAITLPAFTPVEDSLLLTLYCRALDNRLSKPILSDATADEIVRKLDYDFASGPLSMFPAPRPSPVS
jgi:O-methyltransferase involved in polyketide biosynthesis